MVSNQARIRCVMPVRTYISLSLSLSSLSPLSFTLFSVLSLSLVSFPLLSLSLTPLSLSLVSLSLFPLFCLARPCTKTQTFCRTQPTNSLFLTHSAALAITRAQLGEATICGLAISPALSPLHAPRGLSSSACTHYRSSAGKCLCVCVCMLVRNHCVCVCVCVCACAESLT